MKITVGIPCFNQQHHLDGLLRSLEDVSVDDLVIVDDGSDKPIEPVTRRLPVRIFRHSSNLGLASARNTIVREADGDVVLFLDCDVRMRKFSRKAVEIAFSGPGLAAVTGRAEEGGSRGAVDRWRSRFWVQDHGPTPGAVDLAYGLCSAWRRDVLISLGGFRECLRSHGEDVDLSIRAVAAGFSIAHLPEIVVDHRRRDSFSSLLRMVWQHSYYFSLVAKDHRHPSYRRALVNSLKWCIVAPVSSIVRHRDLASFVLSIPCCFASVSARLVAGFSKGIEDRPQEPGY